MSSKTSPGKSTEKRKPQLDAVFVLLTSQRPSDVWRGMEQIRKLLNTNMNDSDVYGLLLDAVQKNRDLREKCRLIILEKMQKGSLVAKEAMLSLPSSIEDTLADADDAYYAAEYDKAIQIYRQVLRLNPENLRAKEHLAKAILKQETGESPTDLPRAAQQLYWRARSYIAARDVIAAMNLLTQAIEAAQAKGMKYNDAEDELKNIQNLVLAEEYINKANEALKNKKRKDAIAYLSKALKLDPTNYEILKIIRIQNFILNIWWIIVLLSSILATFYAYAVFIPMGFQGDAEPPNPTTTTVPGNGTTPTSKTINQDTLLSRTPTSTINLETPTATFTMTPEATFTITATQTEEIIGIGYINKVVASGWQEPNKNKIASFSLYQLLIIIQQEKVSGSNWYKCRWVIDGIQGEGWVLEENITFGNPPPVP